MIRRSVQCFLLILLLCPLLALSPSPAREPAEKDPPVKDAVANSIGQKLVLIPAGEFMMGTAETIEELDTAFPGYNLKKRSHLCDDEKTHRVRITKPFYLGIHEVTIGQFKQFIKDADFKTEAERDGKGGYAIDVKTGKFDKKPEFSWRNPGWVQTDNHPIVNVTWADAVAFCNWLSKKEGKTYRLPTEAEWEYACRAGTKTRYHSGDDPETLIKVANIADASGEKLGKLQYRDWAQFALKGSDGYTHTAPVGSFKPNAFGLYDMHGNVWEWCSDWYGEDYYSKSPAEDPKGPERGGMRVRRGGAWHTFPLWVRASFRNNNTPESRYFNLGFRVARDK